MAEINIITKMMEAIQDKISNLKRLNIIVIGKSGVGKSTLINSVFRGQIAETGLGRPVTQEIRKIEKKDYPFTIYDTPGFELSSSQQKNVKSEIIEIIKKGQESRDISDAIHCIWYCINVGGNRTFDSSEIKWLKEFLSDKSYVHVPIIVVLTQAVPKTKAIEMKAEVEKENIDIKKVIPVLAKDMNFDDEYIAKSYGLDNLIEVMEEVLPESLQDTLQNVQKTSLSAKKRRAQKVISTSVAAAVGAVYTPVPFADATMLVPIQTAMIASITAIYGLEINKSIITAFVSATIGTSGATILGRSVVSNLIKFIPAAGSIVGGLISASTAGALTNAMGQAYIILLEKIYKGEIKKEDINSKKTKKYIQNLIKEIIKKK